MCSSDLAQRFTSILDEYLKAPEVTRKRLFLETMEGVLRDSDKVILEQNGQGGAQGVIPYLPLNDLNSNRPADRGTPRNTGTATRETNN